VAPLTATVLDSVDERHVGIASGVNNGVSRVAGLLAIAVLGAVISASFGSMVDSNLGPQPLSATAAETVSEAKEQPLGVPSTSDLAVAEAARVHSASVDASTSAFHLGILIAGILMVVGGVISGLWIENPRHRVESVATRGSAAAGECGHGADADCGEGNRPRDISEAPAPGPA
jgi:hypothetical protein